MPDEPGGWELRRALDEHRKDMREGFAQINSRLDQLVTQTSFDQERRRVDERLKDLADDIAEEKASREKGAADQRAALEKAGADLRASMDRTAMWLKFVGASVLLPVALAIITVIYQRG